ncbi:AMIN-like domain-containing (lipo)protein [Kribbella kalugense]|uniref:AMIN-like domain-containing protein n=1 Tax=Kribbella kalugense TaxID=2512221 RepID=A0A4R7ZGR9_9ACTN|nr:hypothetical protein [Kribbella kalugense]TDW15521.1 hypothetical protein EV650_7007 [Kribbella kalugense]
MKLFHSIRTTIAVLAVAAVPVVAVPASASAAPGCQEIWGSLPEANNRVSAGTLATVRAGRHTCFDRVVFDVTGAETTYSARYVPDVYRAGAGHLVPLRGGAKLEIMLGVNAFDDDGNWAFQPPNESELANVAGFRTLRQIAYAGDTEGAAWVGIGVRARLPFRVFTLDGPGSGSRVVIDIAHRW